MSIQFCPTCNSILTPITKNSKSYLVCKKCETYKPNKQKEIIIQKEKFKQPKIGKGAAQKNFKGHDFKCKKCQNTSCKLIDLGMMIGDEDWIYLLQCTKCDHSERIGSWC